MLHFDLNETILVTDPAGGDSLEDCINKAIAKNVFVRRESDPQGIPIWENPDKGPELNTAWKWPTGCLPFYDVYRKQAKRFTSEGNMGASLRGLYNSMLECLRVDSADVVDERLCHDGKHHFVLPAFWHTLHELRKQKRNFRIVLRTFGSDLTDVLAAINAYAERAGWNDLLCDPSDCWEGRYERDTGRFILRNPTTGYKCVSEEEALAVIEGDAFSIKCDKQPGLCRTESEPKRCSIMGISDDYDWWYAHNYAPDSGKPLWITGDEASCSFSTCHHIFFDDNIHNKANDGIVALRFREREGQLFRAIPGKQALREQGKFLVRSPTIRPILKTSWFVEQIVEAERRLATEGVTTREYS